MGPTMSLIESIQKYDLEGVKAALQSGADVNEVTKNCKNCKYCKHPNTVISLLLSSPNIDVNLRTNNGGCVCPVQEP